MFKKLIEIGAKILDKLDDSYVQTIPDYTNFNSVCISCDLRSVNEKIDYPTVQDLECFVIKNKESIFEGIVGYQGIKREFVKALNSSRPVGILLIGPPGTCKSEFLKKISAAAPSDSEFINGSYGSKAGIFYKLYKNRPKYVLLDEIDKLDGKDQEALLDLMETGILRKTTKAESYKIELIAWVFATANHKENIMEPLIDRFETYYLTEYTDEEFKKVAVSRLKQEGITDDSLSLYIANAVLNELGKKSFRAAIRIAKKSKTTAAVDETVRTLKRYGDLK